MNDQSEDRLDSGAGEAFESDMEEFKTCVYKRFCPHCGAPVGYSGRGRPRVFCSDRCRWADAKARERRKKKAFRELLKALQNNTPEDN